MALLRFLAPDPFLTVCFLTLRTRDLVFASVGRHGEDENVVERTAYCPRVRGAVPYEIVHWHSPTAHQDFRIQFQRMPYFTPSYLCRGGQQVEIEQTAGDRQAAKPALC